jgi:hypothetical protein
VFVDPILPSNTTTTNNATSAPTPALELSWADPDQPLFVNVDSQLILKVRATKPLVFDALSLLACRRGALDCHPLALNLDPGFYTSVSARPLDATEVSFALPQHVPDEYTFVFSFRYSPNLLVAMGQVRQVSFVCFVMLLGDVWTVGSN